MARKQIFLSGITIFVSSFLFFIVGYFFFNFYPDPLHGRNAMILLVFTGFLIFVVGCVLLYQGFKQKK